MFERAITGAGFPRLTDYSITADADPSYNCIGWTENPNSPRKVWPPAQFPQNDPMEVMDRFYRGLGMQQVEVPTLEVGHVVVAVFQNAKGPTHGALRDRDDPDWWESKLGDAWRIMHRLAELEGGQYGNVVRFYTRREP